MNRKVEEFKKCLDAAELKRLDEQRSLLAQITSNFTAAYLDAVRGANEVIDYVNSLLSQRKSCLYDIVDEHELGLDRAISKVNETAEAINADIARLNASIENREKLKSRLRELNDQMAHIDAHDAIARYDWTVARFDEAKENLYRIQEGQNQLRKERDVQVAKLKMTEIAAASINRFLAAVYFDASRFKLVASGNVYKIESYGQLVAPKDISTGERNILALCYFFSESGQGRFEGFEDADPQYLIIDDPVSSFDMENRVGICSLLRERIAHVFGACRESRVTIMTHDAATVAELGYIVQDIKDEFADSGDVACDYYKLHGNATVQYKRSNAQYSVLLKRAYEYASSEQDNETDSYVIGNILRRILEGYSTFNYGMGFSKLSSDPALKARFGNLEGMLSHSMYRLALNDDSHMEEKIASLNPTLAFERYGYEEKRKLARCVLMILNRLDPEHVKKQLMKTGTSINALESNLRKWEQELSGELVS